jgi:hypothetical protein
VVDPSKTTAKKKGLLHLSSLYGRHQSRDQKRSLHGYLKPQPASRFKHLLSLSSTTFIKISHNFIIFILSPLSSSPSFLSSSPFSFSHLLLFSFSFSPHPSFLLSICLLTLPFPFFLSVSSYLLSPLTLYIRRPPPLCGVG